MLSGLKENQGVVSGDKVLLLLKTGVYNIDDTLVDLSNGWKSQFVSVDKDATIYRVTYTSKVRTGVILVDGTTLTIDEYSHIRTEIFGNYENLDSAFPDTATEIAVKTKWIPYENATYVYLEPKEIQELIEYTIVGSLEPMGSKYIDTPVAYGKVSWGTYNSSGIYRVNVTRVTYDEWGRLSVLYSEKAKFNNDADRNYLRFAKIDGSYAFNDSYNEKKFVYHQTLEEAENTVAHWQKKVKTTVLNKINPAVVSELEASKLIGSLSGIYSNVQSIDSKLKTRDNKRHALKNIRNLITRLEQYIEQETGEN